MLFMPDISNLQLVMDFGFDRPVPFSGAKMSGNEKAVTPTYLEIFIMQYRRAKTPGGTYFFTVVTFRRRKFLCEPNNVELLRAAFRAVKSAHPFTIDAFVLLPDHLHCIWTLPPGDHDYSMRWNAIKNYFTRRCTDAYKLPPSPSQCRKRAQTVWQPRYWEHQIRDERDFEKHCDYIHWNPVKHGLTAHPGDWPYSSFQRYLRFGFYPQNWTMVPEVEQNDIYGE
ncbi:MAG TPA: transposase [Methylobacter sp.]|jgi:putative transposase